MTSEVYRPSEVAKLIGSKPHTVRRAFDRVAKRMGTAGASETVRLIPASWVGLIREEVARCAALPQIRGQRGQL